MRKNKRKRKLNYNTLYYPVTDFNAVDNFFQKITRPGLVVRILNTGVGSRV